MKPLPAGCTNSLQGEARKVRITKRIAWLRDEQKRIEDQIYILEQEAAA